MVAKGDVCIQHRHATWGVHTCVHRPLIVQSRAHDRKRRGVAGVGLGGAGRHSLDWVSLGRSQEFSI